MNERRLSGEVVSVPALSAADMAAMYTLHDRLYDNVTEARFRADLGEKDWVILLRDAVGTIRGFSTLLLLAVEVEGEPLRAVFSGDTGIDPAYWGGQALVRCWAGFIGELRARYPDRRLFWFLISKGFRTYLYLPYFFHEFYPRWDRETPWFEQALIEQLARLKYPGAFHAATGVIESDAAHDRLRGGLAEIPPRRLADPHVRFFLARNSGYARGDELVCVAEISGENMKGLARRMLLARATELTLVG